MSFTRFRTINNIGDCLLSDTLETNVIEYFKWGLLEAGAFFNVKIPTSGHFGGDFHKLRLSEDPNYTKGKVWEGVRKDWVWETGVYGATQPIRISGVFVNGVFSSPTGTYPHYVDYPNGRVIFTSALSSPTTARVTCEHSYRYVQINDPSVPWFTKLQLNSFRVDDSHFDLYQSGVYSIPPEQRIQMPTMVIRVLPVEASEGRQIGDNSRWSYKEVDFHIITETDYELKQLHDVVHDCYNQTLVLFDKNAVRRNQGFALNYNGSLSGVQIYPKLVAPTGNGGYAYNETFFKSIRSFAGDVQTRKSVFYGIVRVTMQTPV